MLFNLQAALAGCMSGSTRMVAAGLLVDTEAPVATPNSTDFFFPCFVLNAQQALLHPNQPCAGIEAVARVMETWQKHEGVQCNCCLALMALVRGTGSICQVTLALAHSPAYCTIPHSGLGALRGRALAREI